MPLHYKIIAVVAFIAIMALIYNSTLWFADNVLGMAGTWIFIAIGAAGLAVWSWRDRRNARRD